MIREDAAHRGYTELSAIRQRRFWLNGSPVFGLTSKRGKLLLEMSTRMR